MYKNKAVVDRITAALLFLIKLTSQNVSAIMKVYKSLYKNKQADEVCFNCGKGV